MKAIALALIILLIPTVALAQPAFWKLEMSDNVVAFACGWLPFYFTITVIYYDSEGNFTTMVARTILLDIYIEVEP